MEHSGWVIFIAAFIWSVFGIGGTINNGLFHANASELFKHAQAVNIGVGFIASGIYLLFYYPYVGAGFCVFGAYLCVNEYRNFKLYERKMEKQDRGNCHK
ncbi:hypothetical protein [Buttiauxella gaviniae]|uniref:hypothetical protein n=1 Tax=Buttiauxella gaviniae TaxID=82990 RepID=UPI003C73653D